ncbi:MAG: sulfotransferase [Acetobacteraceae bacterium]|nr:sulfotransferase [Acetobacteraceae bacterium]
MQRSSPARLVDTAILVLGAQRSGTSWLGKILDSHPDVLYRHEPDELQPRVTGSDAASVRTAVQAWIAERHPRSAAKRPFFRKSWQGNAAFALRGAVVYGLAAAERLPGIGRAFQAATVPDFGDIGRARIAIKSISGCDLAGDFARALPDSRTLLILRHPCGQVASVMRGNQARRFALREAGTDMPFDEAQAVAFAARHGVTDAAFQALPDAAKYAWSWRAFNETAFAALDGLPNALVVVYEDLCARPEPASRALLTFAGLDWTPQTAAFLARSTSHAGATGYYAVLRVSSEAAEAWRTRMQAADQAAVRAVVAGSPLLRFWPDPASVART